MKKSELKSVKVSDLEFYERNSKNHTEHGIDLIKQSIQRNGWGDALLVDGDTMQVLSGNGRLMAAKELGIDEVDCRIVYGLTDKQKADLNIASNKLQEVDGYNENLYELIEEFDLKIEELGMNIEEVLPVEIIGKDKLQETEHGIFIKSKDKYEATELRDRWESQFGSDWEIKIK